MLKGFHHENDMGRKSSNFHSVRNFTNYVRGQYGKCKGYGRTANIRMYTTSISLQIELVIPHTTNRYVIQKMTEGPNWNLCCFHSPWSILP
jgi:hypothetical protein